MVKPYLVSIRDPGVRSAQLTGMETGLTRTIILLALTCFLIVGAATASVLRRTSIPIPSPQMSAVAVKGPSSNKEGKRDRLTVAVASTSSEPMANLQGLPESLRQAFASESPADVRAPKVALPIAIPQQAPPKAKVALKPAVQKSYALLSDMQIAGIKERMKLDPGQESYWPAVETALRAIARKIHATRQSNPKADAPLIDPDSSEVQQLKSAAMPLLFQLREDQKREVRSLANLIGLGAVASMI
jgi:hypothetical protein